MQQSSTWRCPAPSCRAVLGLVDRGVLRPAVPVAAIERDGTATLCCPACGAERVWGPRRVGAAR